jgi:cobalt/nickel transport system permease protein
MAPSSSPGLVDRFGEVRFLADAAAPATGQTRRTAGRRYPRKLRHSEFELWSRRSSPLHRWDARLKLLLLLVYLVTLALQRTPARAAILSVPLVIALGLSRLPVPGLLARAAFVLPFSLTFALVAWLTGDPQRGALLVGKSYLSAVAVALLAATAPLPQLMAAAEWMGAPRALVWIVQLVYRYLFVVFEKAARMRQAAECRAGSSRQMLARAGSGLLAVLFAGAHQHATGVHHAMLARGFGGHLPSVAPPKAHWMDWAFFAASAIAVAALPWVW